MERPGPAFGERNVFAGIDKEYLNYFLEKASLKYGSLGGLVDQLITQSSGGKNPGASLQLYYLLSGNEKKMEAYANNS